MYFELPAKFAESHDFDNSTVFEARYDSDTDRIVVIPAEKDDNDAYIKDAFYEGYDEGFDEGIYDGFTEGYRAGFDDSKNGSKYDPDKRFDELDEEPEYHKRRYQD